MRRSASVAFAGPASPGLTLAPLRRGRGDPCHHDEADGTIWRTSLMGSGPVTARIRRAAPDTVECEAWGPGAAEFVDTVPALLGAHDDASGFHPTEPTVAAALRRVPHLRLGR
ncbi:MAG: DNA-3-methyladenine glycosylase 2 family protein, partial [Actinomycetota bacterium]|nr:DNA-3-methyladenine glycosylase 2 family protein [Actinomycetota bacterium]